MENLQKLNFDCSQGLKDTEAEAQEGGTVDKAEEVQEKSQQ